MESSLAPFLGTSLLLCTLMLMGLALPYSAREAYLRATAQDGENFSAERIERVTTFLPMIGFEDEAGLETLASTAGLESGRVVLTNKCTQCHDLRTILVMPRTPEAWHSTVKRMATRSTTLNPITEAEQWAVTAYLIAISPTLQEVVSEQRALRDETTASQTAVRQSASAVPTEFDAAAAKTLFEAKCSQCHSPSLVERSKLDTPDDAVALVTRMVRNGLTAQEEELGQIMAYLSATYASE